VIVVEEGKEGDAFWVALGGKGPVASAESVVFHTGFV
jgi:hypothetical protein